MAFYGCDVLIGGEFEDMMQTGELEDMMQTVSNGGLDTELLSCFPDALGESSTREKAHRLRSSKIDYWESPWGLQMLHSDVCDPTTREGKLFRSRFRVPFPFFALFLLPAVVAAGIWKDTTRTRVPAAFKLLAVLRGLGRALIMDDLSEVSHIAKSTCSTLIKDFCTNFVLAFFAAYVCLPRPGSDAMAENMREYALLGVPLIAASVDAVHVRLWHCGSERVNQCKGKEGYPSLAWLCAVSHRKEILYVGKARFGALNDIQQQHNDEMCKMLDAGLLDDVEFFLYTSTGERVRCSGACFLTDGGFDKAAYFVEPLHTAVGADAVLLSEWLESIRKDVECTFGILKGRFRVLRLGVEQTIMAVWCVFHV